MKLSEGVEWAAHCVVVLSLLPEGGLLSSARLAEYHDLPAPYLAKSLQALATAGIVAAAPGRNGGYRLNRPPSEITLLDVVEAVDGDDPLFRCTEIRRNGPLRRPARQYTPRCGIAEAMDRAEDAWRAELATTTIAHLALGVTERISPSTQAKADEWLERAVTIRPAR